MVLLGNSKNNEKIAIKVMYNFIVKNKHITNSQKIQNNLNCEANVFRDKELDIFHQEYLDNNKDNINLFSEYSLHNLVGRYQFHLKSLIIRRKRYARWSFWLNSISVISIPLLLLVLSFNTTTLTRKDLLVTFLSFLVSFVGTFSKILRADDKCKLASEKLIEMQDWKQETIRNLSRIKTNKNLVKFLTEKNSEISIIGNEILEGLFYRS